MCSSKFARCVLAVVLLCQGMAWAQGWTPGPLEDVAPDARVQFSPRPEPIRLVAPINGVASGQVVVRGDARHARVGALSGEGGAVIPAAAVQVRFAAHQIPQLNWEFPRFDALLDEPLGNVPIRPVWVTVRVPGDAPPGEYRGVLQVGSTQVPIELRVGAYRLPEPKDWATIAFVMQSPESVAATYRVPVWSDPHFVLLERSMEMLGQLGNNVVPITALRNTFFCNEHPMLVFRRQGGQLVPDFRLVDRYLDLYARHNAVPRVLWIEMYDPQNTARNDRPEVTEAAIVEINARGQMINATAPFYGDGGAGDALWSQVVEQMRQRVQQRGWDPAIVMIGAPSDTRPGQHMIDWANRQQPPLQWVVLSHYRGDPRPQGGRFVLAGGLDIGLAEYPYNQDWRRLPQATVKGGWNVEMPLRLGGFRGVIDPPTQPAVQYRGMPDSETSSIGRDYHGFTRIGLDGWGGAFGGRGWGNLFRNHPRHITAPGPRGAVATVRFEMLREGIQETEARIALEKALASGQLTDQQAEEVRQFLRHRNAVRYGGEARRYVYPDDWQDTTARLFDLAGQHQQAAVAQ